MKNLMIFLTWMSCSFAFAELPEFNLTNLNTVYNDPSGSGKIDEFVFQNFSIKEGEFVIEKQASSLFFRMGPIEVVLDDLPAQVHEMKKFEIKKLNIDSIKDEIIFNFKKVYGKNTANEKVNIEDFYIKCDKGQSTQDIATELMDLCLNNNVHMTLSKFELKDDKIGNIFIKGENNNLYFSVVAQGKKIRGWGKVYFKDKEVSIKINKVKWKFINITALFFKQIKKSESEKVKIDRPWIEIQV